MASRVVRLKVVFTNRKALAALNVLASTLGDLAEDFGYREDVQKALKAAKYLGRHVQVAVDESD